MASGLHRDESYPAGRVVPLRPEHAMSPSAVREAAAQSFAPLLEGCRAVLHVCCDAKQPGPHLTIEGCDVVALVATQEHAANVRQHYARVHVVNLDQVFLHDILHGTTFDAVVVEHVLDDPHPTLRYVEEARSAIAPDGFVLATVNLGRLAAETGSDADFTDTRFAGALLAEAGYELEHCEFVGSTAEAGAATPAGDSVFIIKGRPLSDEKRMRAITKRLFTANSDVLSARAAISRYESDASLLHTELADVRDALARSEREREALADRLEALHANAGTSAPDAAPRGAALEDLSAKLARAEQRRKQSEQTSLAVSEQLSELLAIAEASALELRDLRPLLAQRDAAIADLETSLAQAPARTAPHDEIASRLRADFEGAQALIHRLETSAAKNRILVDRALVESAESRHLAEQRQHALDGARARVALLEGQLRAANVRLADDTLRLESVDAALTAARLSFEAEAAVAVKLREELAVAERSAGERQGIIVHRERIIAQQEARIAEQAGVVERLGVRVRGLEEKLLHDEAIIEELEVARELEAVAAAERVARDTAMAATIDHLEKARDADRLALKDFADRDDRHVEKIRSLETMSERAAALAAEQTEWIALLDAEIAAVTESAAAAQLRADVQRDWIAELEETLATYTPPEKLGEALATVAEKERELARNAERIDTLQSALDDVRGEMETARTHVAEREARVAELDAAVRESAERLEHAELDRNALQATLDSAIQASADADARAAQHAARVSELEDAVHAASAELEHRTRALADIEHRFLEARTVLSATDAKLEHLVADLDAERAISNKLAHKFAQLDDRFELLTSTLENTSARLEAERAETARLTAVSQDYEQRLLAHCDAVLADTQAEIDGVTALALDIRSSKIWKLKLALRYVLALVPRRKRRS